jgi:hypothetical protein
MATESHPRTRSGAVPRRRRKGADGRSLGTAGDALMVSVLALAIGTLLSAPGMHKSAYNKQPGFKRDVALAVTGPLAGLSGALLLDRPRALVKDAIGRSGEDTINVAVVLPDAPATAKPTVKPAVKPTVKPAATPSAAPAKVAFTPKRKLRLWVAGDSLVITPGYSIVRAAGGIPVIDSVGGVDGRVATGLTRPDVFNWFEEIKAQTKKLRPTVVVLDFGGNDDKRYMTGLPEGVSIGEFGDAAWRREYGRRVGGVMDTISRAGGHTIWIGLPITRSPAQTQRFDIVNAVVQQEAKQREGKATYVDTYTTFAGDDGGYAEYLQNASGRTVKVRAGDGVHFEPAGSDMIARIVLKQLNEMYDLTSWRHKPRAAASASGSSAP